MRRTKFLTGKWLTLPGFLLLFCCSFAGWLVAPAYGQTDSSALQIRYDLAFEGPNADRYDGLLQSQTLTLAGAQSHTSYAYDSTAGLVMPEVWVDYAQEQALIRIGDEVYEQALYNLGQQAIIPPGGRYEALPGTRRIAGYTCKGFRAEMEMPQLGGEVKIELWLAPELAVSAAEDTSLKRRDVRLARGLLGLPLFRKLEMKSLGVTLISTAVSVDETGTIPPPPTPGDGFDPRTTLPALPPAE